MLDHKFIVRETFTGAGVAFVRELAVLLAVGSGLLWLVVGVGLATAELTNPAGTRAALAEVSRSPKPASGKEVPTLEAFPADNPFVEAWKARLLETPPRLLDAYLARPEAWAGRLLPILERHEVPREFLYLALVESGMDPEARSPAEAVGLWQFRDATARQYGLIVGGDVDERTDVPRATQAAGRYLRALYEEFGTWELAAAAYNAGPGRVRRALDDTGAASYWELIAIGCLPGETRAYVPRFLAVVQLAAERAGRAVEMPDVTVQASTAADD